MATAKVTQTTTTRTLPTVPTVAPRARQLTRDQWMARATEIADRDHLTHRSKWHGQNDAGEQVFSSPSRTQPGVVHIQRMDMHGAWVCGCQAGSWGMPCGHVGASARLWRIIGSAMSEAGQRAQREYDEFAAWLDARGY